MHPWRGIPAQQCTQACASPPSCQSPGLSASRCRPAAPTTRRHKDLHWRSRSSSRPARLGHRDHAGARRTPGAAAAEDAARLPGLRAQRRAVGDRVQRAWPAPDPEKSLNHRPIVARLPLFQPGRFHIVWAETHRSPRSAQPPASSHDAPRLVDAKAIENADSRHCSPTNLNRPEALFPEG